MRKGLFTFFYRGELLKVPITRCTHKNNRTFQRRSSRDPTWLLFNLQQVWRKQRRSKNISGDDEKTLLTIRLCKSIPRGAGLYSLVNSCAMHVTLSRSAFITLLCFIAFTWNAFLSCMTSIMFGNNPLDICYGGLTVQRELTHFMYCTLFHVSYPYSEGKLSTFPHLCAQLYAAIPEP